MDEWLFLAILTVGAILFVVGMEITISVIEHQFNRRDRP